MHIYFSGIGGVGIGPLALIAKQAGYEVSGSDQRETQYIPLLRKQGINIHIGQSRSAIAQIHQEQPIDWLVYSSALPLENPHHPELIFAKQNGLRLSKRDELMNEIIKTKDLELIAIAGTHGKTTTTAMVVWLLKKLRVPVSYLVGTKLSFGDMGHYEPRSKYFVYECDEFDRNFLAFEPFVSLITGVSWDHHEIYPTREDYQQAFKEFIEQSQHTALWQEDFDYLALEANKRVSVQNSANPQIKDIELAGLYNRLDAWLAIQAVHALTKHPIAKLITIINRFPPLHRRMEEIVPGLYTDEAHTPDKIRGGMSVALEMAKSKNVIVVYEPLTNRRQHYMLKDYKDCFSGAKKVYWLPSYLAREDPNQRLITPEELISHLADSSIAEAREINESLKKTIQNHLDKGDMVVAMAGGGGSSLDEWLRQEFKQS